MIIKQLLKIVIIQLLAATLQSHAQTDNTIWHHAGITTSTEHEQTSLGAPFGGISSDGNWLHFPSLPDFPKPFSASDTIPPKIIFTSTPVRANTTTGFNVSFSLNDSGGIKWARVVYRFGGEVSTRIDTLTAVNGVYSKSILPLQFSLSGFSWCLEISDSAGNISRYPDSSSQTSTGVSIPQGIQFSIESGRSPATGEWHLISLPFHTDNGSAGDILKNTLGVHDGRNWKMVIWNGSGYRSLSDSSWQFTPGQSYYIYSRNKKIDFPTGPIHTVETDKPVQIVVRKSGWTHIAVPFAFPVKWKNFFRSAAERTLLNLEGPLPIPLPQSYTGLADGEMILHPWNGYWVYNPNNRPCTLHVAAISANPAGKVAEESEAHTLFTATDGISSTVTIGLGGSRKRSMPLPPLPESRWNLYIPDNSAGNLMTRILPYKNDALIVDSFIITGSSDVTKRISFTNSGCLPEMAVLWNRARGETLKLEAPAQHTLNGGKWLLIAGNREAIDNTIKKISAEAPEVLSIARAQPNPFNPNTQIKIGLPYSEGRYRICASFVNSNGKVVQRHETIERGAGWHTISFNGKDQQSRELPSGVYICRVSVINAGRTTSKTVKLYLVK
ncbi:MAG: hypothetical protein JNL74_03625 [Fibrobacteres bacterium]|nr:hypothetical protein [Fibrobacterota bacterium]